MEDRNDGDNSRPLQLLINFLQSNKMVLQNFRVEGDDNKTTIIMHLISGPEMHSLRDSLVDNAPCQDLHTNPPYSENVTYSSSESYSDKSESECCVKEYKSRITTSLNDLSVRQSPPNDIVNDFDELREEEDQQKGDNKNTNQQSVVTDAYSKDNSKTLSAEPTSEERERDNVADRHLSDEAQADGCKRDEIITNSTCAILETEQTISARDTSPHGEPDCVHVSDAANESIITFLSSKTKQEVSNKKSKGLWGKLKKHIIIQRKANDSKKGNSKRKKMADRASSRSPVIAHTKTPPAQTQSSHVDPGTQSELKLDRQEEDYTDSYSSTDGSRDTTSETDEEDFEYCVTKQTGCKKPMLNRKK